MSNATYEPAITIIPLTNDQIGFAPKRNITLYVLFCLLTFLGTFTFFYLIVLRRMGFVNPVEFSFLVSLLITSVIFLLMQSLEYINPFGKFFPIKVDRDRKTREDKIDEFWKKAGSSPDLKISRTDVTQENYQVDNPIHRKVTTIRNEVALVLGGLVLFTRHMSGTVTHLEGLPLGLWVKN